MHSGAYLDYNYCVQCNKNAESH